MYTRRIYKLKGKNQHYAWGGTEFIPSLLHIENPSHQPFAEYWMGAHEKAPSEIFLPGNAIQNLDTFIARSPQDALGEITAQRFGRLPYLFKVLDVKEMLSIQVHPTKAEAEKGFARENALGIPTDAPHRNYKDDNHKPEIMVALSDFWLLHGFKMPGELRLTLASVPELVILQDIFEEEGYQGLYRYVMELPQAQVTEMLAPLLQKIIPLYERQKLSRSEPEFWAARAVASGMCDIEKIDRGIFSIYFFNIVQLQSGEGIFQAAGIPHAYLEGQNMELMANSDNVLRGGLTPKHVDVPELLKHTRFEGIQPDILQGSHQQKNAERIYPSSIPDFCLSKINISDSKSFENQSISSEIIFVLSGESTIESNGEKLELLKGEAALILAGTSYKILSKEDATLYKAGVPEY